MIPIHAGEVYECGIPLSRKSYGPFFFFFDNVNGFQFMRPDRHVIFSPVFFFPDIFKPQSANIPGM